MWSQRIVSGSLLSINRPPVFAEELPINSRFLHFFPFDLVTEVIMKFINRQGRPKADAEKEQNQLDRETFSCLICLDLLKDPVTTSCGHSYSAIKKTFKPRPVLKKNTMLAALVEQLKKTGLQAAPADHRYAGHEDVACDFCTGRKLKAIKSCLFCLASYCRKHLQPHYDSAAFKKHKLVEPSKNLQENICSKHDEVMKMFCRTDQKCDCLICLMEEHKGHDVVSAAAERTERQRELEERRGNIQQRIQDREKDEKLLQQEVEAINRSADKTVEDSKKIFSEDNRSNKLT
ncbi:tripartite motif-containing protein 29-like [Xiphophorus maculatus]|uniref:tripartite motif-containing protein 29-like n=1 Tax=Xiphophorus maculatus TaxID=8083 RepID=UPI000C6CF821|nr:tripartite motif-containing protein 29-like [Xiphophorus maculatus]